MKRKLADIAEIQIGYQLRGAKGNVPEGPFRLIQMRDIDEDGRLDADGLISLDLDAADRYRVESGDIVFQARGSRHFAFVLDSVPPNTLASNHFYIVRVRGEGILPPYVAWWMNQPPAQAQFVAQAHKTTMTLVPREAFASLEVEIPPLTVQHRIVELNTLARREKQLAARLQTKRDALVDALCLQAARENATAHNESGETPDVQDS